MKHHQQNKEAHKQDTHMNDINADLLKALILIRDQADNSPIEIRAIAAQAVAKAEAG
jgi:hypothetical protein